MSISEQVVLNKKGKPVAVQIPMSQYKKLLVLAEEMEDIKAYDTAMKRKHQFTPFDKAVKELKAKRKTK
jgi:antitoxin (DNA-binding transcriptional repressor) of toxin-antitoxin stability system